MLRSVSSFSASGGRGRFPAWETRILSVLWRTSLFSFPSPAPRGRRFFFWLALAARRTLSPNCPPSYGTQADCRALHVESRLLSALPNSHQFGDFEVADWRSSRSRRSSTPDLKPACTIARDMLVSRAQFTVAPFPQI